MTVIGSFVASTLWHVLKIYPLTRECIDSLQSEICLVKETRLGASGNVYVGLFEWGSANY
jgi:hypothetical protein